MASMGDAQRVGQGGLSKLTDGPRTTSDLSKVGGGLTRGPNQGKKLNAAAWSETWPAPGSTLDLDFANDRGWVRGVGQDRSMDAVTFTRASVGKYVDQDGIVQDADNGQPRFDWASTEQVANKNLLSYTEQFNVSTYWQSAGAAVTADSATAPDGSVTADTLDISVGGIQSRLLSPALTVKESGTYVASIYLKALAGAGTGTFPIRLQNITTNTFIFGFTVTINDSSWTRAEVTISASAGDVLIFFPADLRNGGSLNKAYGWGAQLELGDTATTYQPIAQPTTSTPLAANPTSNGLLIEEARANRILWCRDATQANWVSTNVTAAKDQTGIDGVANAASSLTATANDGTCIQTITLASGSRTGSVYLKRITGTGNVQVSLDGSTYSTVDLSASEWRRIVLSGTVTNPTVGIKLAVSGDAVAMDYGQVEDGAFVTSPILTTTASVTRAVDLAEIAGSNFSFFTQQEETSVIEFLGQGATAGLLLNSANIGNLQILNTGVARHANGISNLDTAANYTAGNFGKAAVSGNRAKRVVALNGITSLVNPQPVRSTTTVANVRIGGTAVTIKRATMLPKAITESALEAITK
jgi:hypothetical protein